MSALQSRSQPYLSASSVTLTQVQAPIGTLTSRSDIASVELPDWNASTRVPAADTIVEASRIADSTAPDGGYGWVIVGTCSLLAFWLVGIGYSWGVIQDALVEQGLSKASTLAFVGSLATACLAAFAVVNGRLIRAIGARKVGILGIVLMGSGQILSGWTSTNLAGLFITAGCITGYGISCCYMVISVTPAQYFKNRRGLANGLISAAGGLGGAVISLSMSAMLERSGTAWTFRVIGLATLITGLPAAWFVKERISVTATTFIECVEGSPGQEFHYESTRISATYCTSGRLERAHRTRKLFRDMKFALLFVAGIIATFPLFVPPFFLPLYARSIGQTAQVGAALVAAFNFSSAIGRIICGLMGDKLGPLNSLSISLAISAVSMLILWPVSTTLVPLVLFVVINGIGNGGFFAIMPTVVGNVFGSGRVSVAMGMIVTGWTGGYLLGAPIAGYILEASGGEQGGFKSYRPAIFYAGSMALGAAGLVVYVRLRTSYQLWARV